MARKFIVEVCDMHFHIFPDNEISQERHMKHIRPGKGIAVKTLYQKDGSKFKTMHMKSGSGLAVINKLAAWYDGASIIWHESIITKEQLLRLDIEDCEYRAYHLHTFINGIRYLPILINNKLKTHYNLSKFFPNKIPEDDIGVLVKDVEELSLLNQTPEVLPYLSNMRLCSCCGRVSDVSKKYLNPWMLKKRL